MPNIIYEKAYILGNGPSLKEINLKKYSQKITFGMNAAYRYWRKIDWYPNYYSCLDLVLGESHLDAIIHLIKDSENNKIKKFLLREKLILKLKKRGIESNKIINFDQINKKNKNLKSPLKHITTGAGTVAWAMYEGFKKILILGVDNNYAYNSLKYDKYFFSNRIKVKKDFNNENYFFNEYSKEGDMLNMPNLHKNYPTQTFSWIELKEKNQLKENIFNCNVNSKVTVFPIIDFLKFEKYDKILIIKNEYNNIKLPNEKLLIFSKIKYFIINLIKNFF